MKMSRNNKEELLGSEFNKSMDYRKVPIYRKKGKRFRSAFTTDQVNHLESLFEKHPYIEHEQRKEVAAALNIPEKSVTVWFQNRRMREKNMLKELDVDYDNYHTNYMTFSNVHDASSTSNHNLYVLPLMTSRYALHNVNNMNTDATEDNKNHDHSKTSFLNEILPKHEKSPIDEPDYKVSSPVLIQNTPAKEASAEFSTNLCKKYKSMLIKRSEQEKSSKAESQTSGAMASNSRYLKHEQDVVKKWEPRHSLEIRPEDLSHKAKRRNKSDTDVPVYSPSTSCNNFDFQPVYVAQPYLQATNVTWNPINILPIVTAGASGASISSDKSEPVPDETRLKKNCCDCHVNPPSHVEVKSILPDTNQNQQPHYIITGMPFSKYPKF